MADAFDMLIGQAAGLAQAGRHQEALIAWRQATAIRPAGPQAQLGLGEALLALGRPQEALAPLSQALTLDAELDAARYSLGRAHEALHQPDLALPHFAALAQRYPTYALAWFDLGKALQAARRLDEALGAYERAATLDPDLIEAPYQSAAVLLSLDRPDAALAVCDQLLARDPASAGIRHNRGLALYNLGQVGAAQAELETALQLDPGFGQVRYTRALIRLSLGDYADGLEGFEDRLPLGRRMLEADPRRWRGEPLAGRTLLVHWEEGLGDTLQFCRYLPRLAALGARVVFSCQARLRALMASLGGDIVLIGPQEVPDRFDFHIPLMSLPRMFGDRLQTLPAQAPYLAAQPDRVRRWRERIGGGGFKIGLSWRGDPLGVIPGRSIPLAALAPLAGLPGVRLISLQSGAGLEELDQLPPGMTVERPGEDYDAGPDGFLDAAAVMEAVELVVSNDTALVHLAGALGRPGFVGLKFIPDWRWGLEGERTPWHPSLRLFRQPVRGDWDSVAKAMAQALGELAQRPG